MSRSSATMSEQKSARCSSSLRRSGRTARLLAASLATSLLAGCATTNAARADLAAEIRNSYPTCTTEAQCKAMWEAAQVWVAQHAPMKIQTATDVLLETYGGGQYSAQLAIRVLKVPQGGGVYRLEITAGCNNVFGCVPDRYETALAFNRAIGAVTP